MKLDLTIEKIILMVTVLEEKDVMLENLVKKEKEPVGLRLENLEKSLLL